MMAVVAESNVFDGMELEERFKCSSCDEYLTEDEVEPAYECGNCGNVFNRSESDYESHRCSQCGKFASKLTDAACMNCGGGAEAESVQGASCPVCDEFVEETDFATHCAEHAAA